MRGGFRPASLLIALGKPTAPCSSDTGRQFCGDVYPGSADREFLALLFPGDREAELIGEAFRSRLDRMTVVEDRLHDVGRLFRLDPAPK